MAVRMTEQILDGRGAFEEFIQRVGTEGVCQIPVTDVTREHTGPRVLLRRLRSDPLRTLVDGVNTMIETWPFS